MRGRSAAPRHGGLVLRVERDDPFHLGSVEQFAALCGQARGERHEDASTFDERQEESHGIGRKIGLDGDNGPGGNGLLAECLPPIPNALGEPRDSE